MKLIGGQPGGILYRLPYILLVQLGVGCQDPCNGGSCRQRLEDHADGDPHAAEGGLSKTDTGIDGDAVQLPHMRMVALAEGEYYWSKRWYTFAHATKDRYGSHS
jgi:hypothetical protein